MRKFFIGLTAVAVLVSSANAMGGDKGKKHGMINCINKVSHLTKEQHSALNKLVHFAKSKKGEMKRMMIPKGNLANFLSDKGFDKSAFITTKKMLMGKKIENKATMINKMLSILTPAQILELKKIVQVKATKKLFKNLSPKAILELRNDVEKKALVK